MRRTGGRTIEFRAVTNVDLPAARSRFAPVGGGNYDIVLAVFCGLLLISNVSATKLIEFGPRVELWGFPVLPIIADGGALLFPLTYVLGDVLAEVYGMRGAKRAIWVGFGLAAAMSLTFLVVGAAPPASSWPNQEAWGTVLGFVPRIVIASLMGYLIGQFLNATVLVRMKKRAAGEKGLWKRLVASTLIGELADTVVFCTIAFGPYGVAFGGGSLPWPELVNYILVGWIYKVLVEVLALPVTYRVITAVKRREPEYW